MCQIEGAQSVQSTDQESLDMNITTIGIDLAKNTFSLRGTDTQSNTDRAEKDCIARQSTYMILMTANV